MVGDHDDATNHALRPALLAPPRRRSPVLGLAIGLALPPLALAVMFWDARPQPPRIVHESAAPASPPTIIPFPTTIVSIAAPLPSPASAARPSCPPPRTDAPRLTPPKLDEAVEHIRPSPTNAGWIAAWNDDHVFVSLDAGASFRRVLDGPGAVRDVGFDCFGRVVVARASGIGVRDGTRERWRPLAAIQLADWVNPQDDGSNHEWPPELRVLGGGPDLVVAGHRPDELNGAVRVAVSPDLGASWRYHDLDETYVEGDATGRQHPDGTIDLGVIVVDCRSEDLVWVRISPTGVVDTAMFWIDGFDHALVGDVAYSRNQQRRRGGEDWTPIRGLEDVEGPTAIAGPSPLVVANGRAYKIANGRARALPWVVEGDEPVADPAGRIWSVVCGQPWIAVRTGSGRTCEPDEE